MQTKTTIHFTSLIPVHIQQPNHELAMHQLKIQIGTKIAQAPSVLSTSFQYMNNSNQGDGRISSEIFPTQGNVHQIIGNRVLEIVLTDENDLLFLYKLNLTEEGFIQLKSKLNLLIEFKAFHSQLEMMLKRVLNQDSQPQTYKILLELNGADATFSVVETDNFRQHSIVSLDFKRGNDEQLKEHLSAEIKKFRKHSESLQNELDKVTSSSNREIENLSQTNHKLAQQLQELKQRANDELNSIKMDSNTTLNDLKENHSRELIQLQQNADKEKSLLQENYQRQVSALQTKLDNQQSENNKLSSQNYQLTSTVKEQKARLDHLEKELSSNQTELIELRGTNKNLDTLKFNNEKNLSKNQMELVALRQHLSDKDVQMNQLQQNLSLLQETNTNLQQQLEQAKADSKQSMEKYKAASSEILKGNDIIKKLQIQLRAEKTKAKQKKFLIRQQEAKVQKEIEERNKIQQKLAAEEQRSTHLTEEVENLKQKLDSKKSELKNTLSELDRANLLNRTLGDKMSQNQTSYPYKLGNYSRFSTANQSGLPPRSSLPNNSTYNPIGNRTNLNSSTLSYRQSTPVQHSSTAAGYHGITPVQPGFKRTSLSTPSHTLNQSNHSTSTPSLRSPKSTPQRQPITTGGDPGNVVTFTATNKSRFLD